MKSNWKQEEVFPIIARIIGDLAGKERSFVSRAQIAASLLKDSEGSTKIDAAVAASAGEHTREWQAVNMVDWFSKSITEGSKWAAQFERKRIKGTWAYKPKS